jgi:hypothetical protein
MAVTGIGPLGGATPVTNGNCGPSWAQEPPPSVVTLTTSVPANRRRLFDGSISNGA